MLGPVRHEEVRDVMVRGHIYLHPSLTEAFGTVLVEAASCGLYVVCTRVGGIPEVLPSHMTVFARPEEDDLVSATSRAIKEIRMGRVKTEKFHEQVKSMYSWTDVAERTERVYEGICRGERVGLMERLKRYYGCGVWAGKLFVLCVVVDYLILVVCSFFFLNISSIILDIDTTVSFPAVGVFIPQKWNRYCPQLAKKGTQDSGRKWQERQLSIQAKRV